MEGWAFNPDDLRLMKALGISESQVREQVALLQKSSVYLRLQRPCTLGDGIERIPLQETEVLILLQEKAARESRFIKFVPASGAATRMFQELLSFSLNRSSFVLDKMQPDLSGNDPEVRVLIRFLSGLQRFAFFRELNEAMARDGLNIAEVIRQKQWPEILDYLLTERGLNYLNRPKGLHQFHVYPEHNRTAIEEHLIEAMQTICDRTGQCHLHVTISPEHEATFRDFFDTIRPTYESRYRCRLKVTFSFQTHSTDTLAVDPENRPFRDDSGNLLFRPGGHGALLQNLNDLKGDLIYIKNIDNVLPDRLKKITIDWKKVLGGYLVKIQQMVHGYLRKMIEGGTDPAFFSEARAFCRDRLWIIEPSDFNHWAPGEQKSWLVNSLNRPIRVCGMVRNEGEPGGGPFWVEGKDGILSRQIVEGVQVDPASAEQKTIWASSTHFNPVDLVCSVRDYKGRPFDLNQYVDRNTFFIARKSHNGQDFKALELPGLWNGSMAKWISLFVEVPIQTFSPVKTINDLLRPEHQNEA
ncbi:MAG: DUF4301 family protein [Deltaproteobacteria bacterium]|nr:DUF4301 family protein [Deltaproteobacteria bacterium]